MNGNFPTTSDSNNTVENSGVYNDILENYVDPFKKYRRLYFILPALGAIALFIATFTPFGAAFGAFIGVGLYRS
ncbi:hypothetical protein [Aneurinibacillus aneurinilyticus]|uniref:Uncharacterized protein n=1 Tax=Aneurinibacillus aneurinilyticus ATCC 12856 TaxID=649747 RepID=U1Y4U0_ANEAE|nr:hypothetical protein [Aneurinibacillus aneurinilyticus]ERI07182.1 hypothetical protein HMPREF0083_04756 [Aneurinibacillus aneurinilyticus ATCC 12856]MED0705269.1 hypothetical protein [Aneurinibacillus aneurinilyticus]MED0722483.1 hypothetical protein [Aneurinibacillus aneurinilyticus]MED0733793.1 hypothetical protein [Aneurinibacillus aneurinilyticus]MED0739686.1 hypothetical protein [Aneurinibacillus aneurinilyticus]